MGDPVMDVVLAEIADVLGLAEVRAEQRMPDLGADSVTLLRLMGVLQERFDISMDVVDIFTAELAGDLVATVEASIIHSGDGPRR
jgi:acyl carrier protein